jgi:hypothetical protein
MTFPDIPLPNRPLALKAASITTPRGYAWAAPFMFVLAGFLLYWQGPDLLRDYQISQNPLLLEEGEIRDGECNTRKAVFTDCEARLVYTYEGKSYDSEVHIFFVDAHSGDYETGLVISADHPELATISLGLDKLWNRIISFGALIALIGGLCLTSVFLGFRVAWVRSRLTTPAALTPIPVEITAFNERGKTLFVTYADKLAEKKTKRTAYTRFTKGREPIIIGEANGHAVALAVRHGKTSLPILLDDRLERIMMTEEERAAALAVIHAEQEAEAEAHPPSLREPAKKGRILRGILTFFSIILLFAVGLIGFWFWYVLSSPTQFNQIGMEINNLMPQPVNEWGCDQLQKRFGNDRAPHGCAAGDFTSWK